MENNYNNANGYGANNDGYELDWDGVIENDSPDFVLLPDGDYDFTVEQIERGHFSGSEKMPACKKVTVHMKFSAPQGETTIKKDLFLHSKCEGILCAFFACIGQRKHGERISMNWSAVPGAKGRARVSTRTYNGKQYNEVKRFLEPDASAGGYAATTAQYQQTAQSGYVPGKF